jgi:hypothetical protein
MTVTCVARQSLTLHQKLTARIAALEAHIARLEAIGDVFLKTLADSLEDPLHWNDDAAQAEKDWNQAKEAKP